MGSGNKKLKSRDSTGNQIKGHETTVIDYRKLKPVFSLEYMGVRGFCISECDVPDKAIFMDAILKRGRMTWEQLIQEDHTKLGFEILRDERINQRLREKSLKPLSPDAKLKVFRAKSDTLKRFVGHRENNILYLLFYDKDGSLYKHSK